MVRSILALEHAGAFGCAVGDNNCIAILHLCLSYSSNGFIVNRRGIIYAENTSSGTTHTLSRVKPIWAYMFRNRSIFFFTSSTLSFMKFSHKWSVPICTPDNLIPWRSTDVPSGRIPFVGAGKFAGTNAWHFANFSWSPALFNDSSAKNFKIALHNSKGCAPSSYLPVILTQMVKSSVVAFRVGPSVANAASTAS